MNRKRYIIAALLFLFLTANLFSQTATMPSGSGTEGDPYLIGSLDNLYWVTQNSGSWNKYFKQTADIDASSTSGWDSNNGYSPIGNGSTNFTGHFDGDGHTISGLFISRGGTNYVGMFGFASSAEIKNIGLINVNITGNEMVAGLVGLNFSSSTVSNSYSTGSVAGVFFIGGLVGGSSYSCLINKSYSAASVNGTTHVGGLVGASENGSVISNSYFTGSVNGAAFVGGIAGDNASGSTVINCYSIGGVGASSYPGGLVGYNLSSVSNSFWDTQTSGQSGNTGGTGKTTVEMRTPSTFIDAGWDFADTWAMYSGINNGYPYLQTVTEFSTPPPSTPSAVTFPVTTIKLKSARLNGAVKSSGDTTVVRFLYGTSSGVYTDSIAASVSPLVPWDSIDVSGTVNGLSTSTTYYYRVTATSSLGYFRGSEESFTTLPQPVLSTVPGTLLSFNGTTQYVSVPDESSLRLTDNFTIEAWIYPTRVNSSIIDKGNYNYLLSVQPNGNSGLGLFNNGTWIYSLGTVPLNEWSHVAVVFQTGANGLKFYRNGELLGQHTAPGALITNSGELNIGRQAPGDCNCNLFQGNIDEVRMWDVPRTAQQIRENMHRTLEGTETGLLAYWQLNEGSGSTAIDSIGGHNGTLQSGPAWAASTIPVGGGSSNSVNSFTNGFVQLGTVALTTTDDFDNAVALTATQITIAPNILPGLSSTELTDRYWVVDAFGTTGTFSSTLAFVVPPAFTNSGAASSSSYNLYRRNSTSDGSWTLAVSGALRVAVDTIVFDGITSFSQFTIGTDDALPVELVSFTAAGNSLNIELKWATSTETNNYGFEVERKSLSPTPSHPPAGRAGREGALEVPLRGLWGAVGFIEGSGTSNTSKEYSFTDKNMEAGEYSYRLKQIDNDGKFKYSQEVEVVVGAAPKVFELAQNYPNPFNPTTTIGFTLQVPGFTTLRVYDVIGREVAELFNGMAEAGKYYPLKFNASQLSSGLYFARLESDGKRLMRKMLLVK